MKSDDSGNASGSTTGGALTAGGCVESAQRGASSLPKGLSG